MHFMFIVLSILFATYATPEIRFKMIYQHPIAHNSVSRKWKNFIHTKNIHCLEYFKWTSFSNKRKMSGICPTAKCFVFAWRSWILFCFFNILDAAPSYWSLSHLFLKRTAHDIQMPIWDAVIQFRSDWLATDEPNELLPFL